MPNAYDTYMSNLGNLINKEEGHFGRWLGETFGGNGQDNPGLLGLGHFTYKPYTFDPAVQQNINNLAAGAQGQATLAQQQQQQARGAQMGLLAQLQAQAQGQGPSLAQNQLTQATDANLAQAMALGQAQQGQGLGAASALRGIADQRAALQQNAANQAAQLRAQEQLNAQAQLAGLASGMRGQDLGALEGGNQMLTGLSGQNIQYQGAQAQNQQAGQQIQAGAFGNAAKQTGQFISGLGQAATTAAMLAHGGIVPGYHAGTLAHLDDPRNDTVRALLSPGEIVLPRSVALAEDAPEKAREFVKAVMRAKKYRRAA